MADEASTLNHRITGTVSSALISHVGEQARIARGITADHSAARHGQALSDLEQHLKGLSPDDESMYAIAQLQAASGVFEAYKPGPQVRSLFGRLGVDRPAPSSQATLRELVAAAVDDYIEYAQAELGKVRGELNRAQAEAGRTAKAEERAEAAKQRAKELGGELETANAEVATLREQGEHLRAMLGEPREPTGEPTGESAGATAAEPAEGKTEPPRRVRVRGHVGVYERKTADGAVVYEIGYREDGRQRWCVIGPDLDEAITARANLTEPEEVAA